MDTSTSASEVDENWSIWSKICTKKTCDIADHKENVVDLTPSVRHCVESTWEKPHYPVLGIMYVACMARHTCNRFRTVKHAVRNVHWFYNTDRTSTMNVLWAYSGV